MLSTISRARVHDWPPARRLGQRPIRVMRVITRLNIGGPAYQAIYLTQRLQDPDFETSLLVGSVGRDEGSMEDLAAERQVRFTRVSGLGREISPRSDGLTIYQLYRQMRRFRPDIVHTHLAKAGAVGRLAARLARVPTVVHTYHGHVFHGYFSPRKSRLVVQIEQALARLTDRLIVLGERQEREILGYGVGRPEQMVRIPLGLELESFLTAERHRGRLRRELGIPLHAPVVGIVARLVPIKAHDLFLQAARHIADVYPDAHFLIIGDGESRPALEHQGQTLGFQVVTHAGPPGHTEHRTPNIESRTPTLHFTGFRSDLPSVYADLDVVVLSSRNEGLPVTLIEALAAARPVVATEVGAVRDLVKPGRTGWLAPSGDANALAQGIRRHLDDRPGAECMGRCGREHVHPYFSVDRLEQDIRTLYHHLTDWQPVPVATPERYAPTRRPA